MPPLPPKQWRPPEANRNQGNVVVLPHPRHPSGGSINQGKGPVAEQRRPDQQCVPYAPGAISQLYPTYRGDSEVLVQSLFNYWNRYILGQVLKVTANGDDCLGFFPLPDCPAIPIKFRFRLNSNHRPFLTRRTTSRFFIEGQLQLNPGNLRKYILNHPPGVFLHLHGQTTAPSEIPISVETSAITHKATNATILTTELNEIVDYLRSLGRTMVEGKVLHWNTRGYCQAFHKYERKNRYIKFLFYVPEQHKALSHDELKRSFATIRCRLIFDKKTLIRYVNETGLCGFRGDNSQRTAIAIRGTDIQMIPIDDAASQRKTLKETSST